MAGTSGWLATYLDAEMFLRKGVSIHEPLDHSVRPPQRRGSDIAHELGGRLLLKYILPAQVGTFRAGTEDECYATPTPYSSEEAARYLLLPRADIPRRQVLLLDPARIPWIQGPIWVALARGIQYILPNGFPGAAVVVPGAPGVQWEIPVT
jgi:hypothetical protein